MIVHYSVQCILTLRNKDKSLPRFDQTHLQNSDGRQVDVLHHRTSVTVVDDDGTVLESRHFRTFSKVCVTHKYHLVEYACSDLLHGWRTIIVVELA